MIFVVTVNRDVERERQTTPTASVGVNEGAST